MCTSQLATQLVSLLYTIQGQTSVRLTLHDLVYIVHGLAVTNQQQSSHYLNFERSEATLNTTKLSYRFPPKWPLLFDVPAGREDC